MASGKEYNENPFKRLSQSGVWSVAGQFRLRQRPQNDLSVGRYRLPATKPDLTPEVLYKPNRVVKDNSAWIAATHSAERRFGVL